MLSKNTIKYVKSLHLKKYRNIENKFIAEWGKILKELINSNQNIYKLYITTKFLNENSEKLVWYDYDIIDEYELKGISWLISNVDWIAIIEKYKEILPKNNDNELVLVLDWINDPWNLWTIIRLADRYWIKYIICSENTVDIYNLKVIMSTMWSFIRVNIAYTNLFNYLSSLNKKTIYWAVLDWENIHNKKLGNSWYIIIWNESNWISKELIDIINEKITIPNYWWAESLNAWISAWIILDNFFRNN